MEDKQRGRRLDEYRRIASLHPGDKEHAVPRGFEAAILELKEKGVTDKEMQELISLIVKVVSTAHPPIRCAKPFAIIAGR